MRDFFMRSIPAAELLNIWDRGMPHGPFRRALDLLASAFPELDYEELAREPIGMRDLRLLALREELFGPVIAGTASCPECGELLDLNFQVNDMRVPHAGISPGELAVEMEGYHISFRLPGTVDLASAPDGEGIAGLRAHLLGCCLREAVRDGQPVDTAEVPDAVIDNVLEMMREADPQADLQIEVRCPACSHGWELIFDIASFLWSEIDAWAWRIMREIHALARSYGWSEPEILALSPRRRRIYLAMVTQ